MEALFMQLVAGLLGDMFAGKDEAEQKYLLQKAMDEFGNIDLPALKEVVAQELGPSAMEGLKADPQYAALERQGLDELLRIGRSGGMTLEDKANLNTTMGQASRVGRAGDARIRESMAARGQSGGGAELAMRMASNQGAAQRAHEGGMQVAGQAQKRALDSILEAGRMGGRMGERDFDQRSRAASAADARARHNADARTRADAYNTGLGQQQFGNKLAKASGKSGRADALGNFYAGQAQGTRQLTAGLGKAGADYVRSREYDDEEEGW
jgi:hypothetical protein